jgi:hypothetical protein
MIPYLWGWAIIIRQTANPSKGKIESRRPVPRPWDFPSWKISLDLVRDIQS